MATALQGWFCTCIHDWPEPEGTVLFTSAPKQGQKFLLPSSGFTEEWVVNSVDPDQMSFTATLPNSL